MTDDISGEIQLRSEGGRAHLPDIPRPVLEALHKTVIGTKDSIESTKVAGRHIHIDDVKQLCFLLSQWCDAVGAESKGIRILVKHRKTSGGGMYAMNYSSFDSFQKYDPGQSDPASNLELYFSALFRQKQLSNYNAIDVAIDLPGEIEKTALRIKEENEDEFNTIYMNKYSIKIKVDYTDYLIAKGLVDIVEEWYDDLSSYQIDKKWKFFTQATEYNIFLPTGPGNFIHDIFPPLFSIVVAAGLLRRTDLFIDSTNEIMLEYLILFLGVIYILGLFLAKLSVGSSVWIRSKAVEKVPLLHLNKGNKRLHERFLESEQKRKRAKDIWMISVALGFLVSVLAGIIVNFFI